VALIEEERPFFLEILWHARHVPPPFSGSRNRPCWEYKKDLTAPKTVCFRGEFRPFGGCGDILKEQLEKSS
ncbi:MAG: hypothetical protein IJQ02_14360, partial [Oscillospiraceae bacterium]|nr:hypothetical protein [Oscillospiraceae bacterium]